MHSIKIRKIGNSLGATLPREVLAQLNVGEGDILHLVPTENGIQLTPYDPEFEQTMAAFEDTYKDYCNAFRELAK
ncbi:MAG: AbrB/MazE/SpoVT family DNA-binding domain-containing protein [Cyanobacteria bacterium P01_A01_bin.3]